MCCDDCNDALADLQDICERQRQKIEELECQLDQADERRAVLERMVGTYDQLFVHSRTLVQRLPGLRAHLRIPERYALAQLRLLLMEGER